MQDSFDLPPDYFAQLPNDLRLDVSGHFSICVNYPVVEFDKECGFRICGDNVFEILFWACVKLNDAAFDLSNGRVVDEVSYF